ncbi:MAG: hypothetical protein Kapaf2KO_00360 [Candidatus Kapaibacteriales bacterium]
MAFKLSYPKILSILFISILVLEAESSELYYPPTSQTDNWETIEPSNLGWNLDKLSDFSLFADTTASKALIILQKGKIAFEQYYNGHKQSDAHYWASAGKTLTAFMAGIGVSGGLMSLDSPSSDYLGEGWSSCTPEEERMRTLFQHLTMTTNLDQDTQLDCTSPECLKCEDGEEAGNGWHYHNGAYTIVQQMIANAYIEENLNRVISKKLTPLTGITGLFVKTGDNSVFFSNPRSFARFGLLLSAKGEWNGQKLITDPNYFDDMTTTSQPHNKAYGYLTWLNGSDSYRLPGLDFDIPGMISPTLPSDAYAGIGKNGQIVCVIPSWDIVFIRMGDEAPGLAPTSYLNDLGRHLSDVVAVSSVSNTVSRDINFNIENKQAISDENISLYDLNGRLLESGKIVSLRNELSILLIGDIAYLVSDYGKVISVK